MSRRLRAVAKEGPPATVQAAGGPGSISPRKLYNRLEQTATPIWLPNVRRVAGGFTGPVAFPVNKDWVRYTGDFSVQVLPLPPKRSVASITFDVTAAGLTFNPNPARSLASATSRVWRSRQ
jgi:hypothetical protein